MTGMTSDAGSTHGASAVHVSPRRDDEDRLPWLEPAALPAHDSVPAGKLFALIVAALVVLATVAGGVWMLRHRTGAAAANDPTLIAADPGDYKVRPDAPGGMKVEGRGDSAFATSEGAEANGRVDLNALPETPVAGAKRTADATDAGPKAATTATVGVPQVGATLVARTPEATGPAVQLGAFPSEAVANASWSSLSRRFSYLAPLDHSVQSAQVNGATVFRLRASAGGDADSICGKLRAAGQACLVIG